MTITERKAREATTAKTLGADVRGQTGRHCELLFNDLAGNYDANAYRYFLDHDGDWYRIDPPARVYPMPSPMNWRPGIRHDHAGAPALPQETG